MTRTFFANFGFSLLVVWLVHIIVGALLIVAGIVRESWLEALTQIAVPH